MANHKNLKKVIAVSSMAAVTMGAGAMVNADNVHQQPVSSPKSSISTKVSSESQSVKSSSKVVLKSSQTSSAKATTSSVASSSSKASASTNNKMNLAQKTSASSQDSEQASSENHGNGTPNVTPAQSDDIVNALQPKVDKIADDINKDENSNDPAVIDALSGAAKAADEITDTVNNFIYGKATPADTMNAIKNFENKIAELQKQIANEKNPTIKAILQDELDAYQATVNKLEEYLNNKSSVPAGTVSHSGNSNSAETVSHSENSGSTKKSGSPITSSMTAKKIAKNEKAMKANSAKKASMPQTGEANNNGILAGIGALAIAAAGAFLFRKRG
ncbi:LPXTG cell wall anchor domain-containing protein [Ligilactobacillus aviarius]|uniref:LPXTG cell wall anchor domain-containing protein n=1 Tax=Ligilactobacillus aviarius TaxID=1606 RepID=UPI0024BB7640|nr:LPXTG cell wall anchor domain-containing protein [Ligilactobacillus aviarius]